MLESAFNLILSAHSRPAVLRRMNATGSMPASITTNIRVTPSNYFRNLAGPSHTIIEGREFVISKASIVAPFTPILKRGDRIEDVELGHMAIDEIQEMYDFGGSLMGFRVRCE